MTHPGRLPPSGLAMLLHLLALFHVWWFVLGLNASLSPWPEISGSTEKISLEGLDGKEVMLNRSNSRSKLWPSVLLDEDEKQFELGEGNVDTEPKLDWDDKQRARARMLGIALELERKFHPLYLGNRTHNFAVDRIENIEKKASFSDSLKALVTLRISSSLNFTQNMPTTNKDGEGQKSVYDMILIDKNRDEDEEAQKERELKRLQEIQEQRRIRMKHANDKYGTHHMGEYVYLLPIEWMLDGGSVPYPPGYYPINLYDLIIDNDPSLNLSLVPQRDGLPRRKDQVQLRYLPANLHAALIPAAFTSMDIVSLLLLMAGWFLFLLCAAALIGIRAETQAATKCSFNISKNLIYQRELRKDPGLTDRLKKQAEEAGITPNTWHYLVLRKKDIGDDVFNRIALCIQHYYSFYDLVKGWEVLKNSDNPEIAKSAIALMDAFLAREYDYMSAKEVRGPPQPSMLQSKRDWQYV